MKDVMATVLRTHRLLYVLLLAFAVAGGGYAAWRYQAARDEAPKFRLAKLDRGPVIASVSTSGTLAPVSQVQIGSQVSGQIKEILADFNSEVKAGQILARIDPESFEARVAQAAAELEVAEAAVLVQRATIARAKSDTQRAAITVQDTEREFRRKRDLAERGVGSTADKERQEAQAQGAEAQFRGAKAADQIAEAQLANAQATVKQRQAALRQARIDLERSMIRSPVDGVVILRNVDAGQTVAASLQAPILFTVAETLTKMQVEASVDEADIGRLAEGMSATFTVDSLPGRQYDGVIRQIRKSPQVVQNVVTYTVVIAVDNPDQKLLPGMTATVRIVVEQRPDALRIPNAALRYRAPAGVTIESAGGGPQPQTQSPAAAGGGMQAARDRLVRDLKLTESQAQAVDAIFAEGRAKFASLGSDLTEAQRRQAIERNRAEARARIAQILTPEQRQIYQAMGPGVQGASSPGSGPRGMEGRAYQVKTPGLLQQTLRVGITDGAYTEVIGGALKEGDEVVVGGGGPAAATPAAGPSSATPRLRL